MSLIGAIRSNDKKLAKKLLSDDKVDLSSQEEGLKAIHWAAKLGQKSIFKELLKRSSDPFEPDEKGFAPMYYAQTNGHDKIIKLIDSHIPLKMPIQVSSSHPQMMTVLRLSNKLDEALRLCGLAPFATYFGSISAAKKSKSSQTFLSQLFISSNSSSSSSDKLFIENINPSLLSEIAFGLIEEVSPRNILLALSVLYPSLGRVQQLSAIYFVKELILQDTDHERTSGKRFQQAFEQFMSLVKESEAFKHFGLKKLMQELYAKHQKTQLARTSSLQSALGVLELDFSDKAFFWQAKTKHQKNLIKILARDLEQAFVESLLNLTPKHFLASNILSETDVLNPWKQMSSLSSKLSQRVCLDVLTASTPSRSAQVIGFYLQVIQECLSAENDRVLNVAGAMAIYNGLQYQVITRLQECKSHLSKDQLKKMQQYEELFKANGNFANLRQLMRVNQCYPFMAVFSADKDKVAQNSFEYRPSGYGRINRQLYLSRLVASSCAENLYRTNLIAHLDKKEYSEDEAYKLSCDLEPPKVIILDDRLSFMDLLVQLKDCLTIGVPLVVSINKQLIKGQMAKNTLQGFCHEHFQDSGDDKQIETVLNLCDEIIAKFAKLGKPSKPVTLKRKKKEKKEKSKEDEKLVELSEDVPKLEIKDKKSLDDAEMEEFSKHFSRKMTLIEKPAKDDSEVILMRTLSRSRLRANTVTSEVVATDRDLMVTDRTFTPLAQEKKKRRRVQVQPQAQDTQEAITRQSFESHSSGFL